MPSWKGVLGFVPGPLLVAAQPPWWALAGLSLVGVLVWAGTRIVQAIFPQNSRDRLEWWKDRRAHLRARQPLGRPSPAPPDPAPVIRLVGLPASPAKRKKAPAARGTPSQRRARQ
ncbi:hypothetical protein [Streptomyces sp. CL12]|uniref:hypothetical protein n=1 Tax=Streptomyces sp. CL12 TaxID=3391744 RepID=UPI003A80EDB2